MRAIIIMAALLIAMLPASGMALITGHQCNYCHSVHGATSFGALLKNSLVETLCMSCHGPGGTSIYIVDVHSNKVRSTYPAFRFTCIDCHDSHDNRANWLSSTNIKTVGRSKDGTGLAKVGTMYNGIQNVVFTSRGTNVGQPSLHSFADGDEDLNGVYDGVCEVCHTLTANHRNNPSGNHVHNVGKTCTVCHAHSTKFNRR